MDSQLEKDQRKKKIDCKKRQNKSRTSQKILGFETHELMQCQVCKSWYKIIRICIHKNNSQATCTL